MKKVKVLIVEDEVLIADGIKYILNESGYEVIDIASSYSEGVNMIDQSLDLILLDINLEGEKTGIDLAEYIVSNFQIPFIFLTSNSDKNTFKSLHHLQPAAFIAKPFLKDNLYAAIELAILTKNNNQLMTEFIDNKPPYKASTYIKHNQFFHRVSFDDIIFVKSDNVTLHIYMSNNVILKSRMKLNDFSEKLPIDFQQIHLRYLINVRKLDKFDSSSVVMQEYTDPISITRKYKNDFLSFMDNHYNIK